MILAFSRKHLHCALVERACARDIRLTHGGDEALHESWLTLPNCTLHQAVVEVLCSGPRFLLELRKLLVQPLAFISSYRSRTAFGFFAAQISSNNPTASR